MKIGHVAAIYSVLLGQLNIQLSPMREVLNFTGISFAESKYKLLANALENGSSFKLLVSDSDRLAFEDLASGLKRFSGYGGQILLFYNDKEKSSSQKRVWKAVKSLRAQGIKVQYCKNVDSAQKWLAANEYPQFDLRKSEQEDAKLVPWKDTHLSLVISA